MRRPENPRRVRGVVHEMSNGYEEIQRVIDRDAPSDACFSFEVSAFRGNSLRKGAIPAGLGSRSLNHGTDT